jgi:hypothetical protein
MFISKVLRLLSITHLKIPLKPFMLNKNVSRRDAWTHLLAGLGWVFLGVRFRGNKDP